MRRILFVCTANICRSPAAELLARHRFGETKALYRSAGFLQPGGGCPSNMIDALADRGIDATDHTSYQIDANSIDAADLLLTMEASHVQKATMLLPDAFAKIVPLKEAASVMAARPEPTVTLEDFLADLNQSRDPLSYLDQRWDVDDPYGRRAKHFQTAVDEIDGLVAAVVGKLV